MRPQTLSKKYKENIDFKEIKSNDDLVNIYESLNVPHKVLVYQVWHAKKIKQKLPQKNIMQSTVQF